jgi:methylenetetrahydrofolate dehydrogenase (NADP+) / methenyltetrahydrofolate cyclohydrolase
MAAKIIDGAALAERVKADVKERVGAHQRAGRPVYLVAVLVGGSPAGEIFAQRQADACRAVGIEYQLLKLDGDSTHEQVMQAISRLNHDPAVTGIMVHLPLPAHLNATELQYHIDPVKDVEGVNPANIGYVVYGQTLIAPFTAQACIELINATGVELRGAEVTVVGASQIVGRPIGLLLTQQMATVTTCHIATRDLKLHTTRADILVAAAGKAGLITADHVKEGAVVIDVGINRITLADGTKKTVGDVDFESVSRKAAAITPVPGGVGPMTVAMLLQNTLRSADLLHAKA